MLEPRDRRLLREALRPPAGYKLDRAISTTFSLDLVALLSMPVSFTLFDVQDSDGRPTAGPLVLLESLRRYAGNITVFCQAGRIAVPRHADSSFAQLENSVVQVTPPAESGVFHPKVAVLRFVESQGAAHASRDVRYRFLCSSRNLTFDRSWDTMLVLEGPLNQQRRNAYARNRPLSRFVRALPGLAVRDVSPQRREDVAKLADELLRVEFEAPEGFEDLAFHPMGLDGAESRPFGRERVDRLLVMSPFVTDGFLKRFQAVHGRRVLISRPEEMNELAAGTLAPFEAFYLDPAVEEDAEAVVAEQENADESPDASAAEDEEDEANIDELTGLHAKLVVADRGWKSHIWTGSANATDAAITSNIEFMVELIGSRKRHGVNTLVRADDPDAEELDANVAMGNLLQPYVRPDEDVEVNADAREAEQRLQDVRRWLTSVDLVAQVTAADGNGDGERYRLTVQAATTEAATCPVPASLRCRPVTLPAHHLAKLPTALRQDVAAFDAMFLESITSFFVFEITVRVNAESKREAFVLNLPLEGAPADRHQRLLLSVLNNREQLLRYLLLLLAQDELDVRRIAKAISRGGNGATEDHEGGFGLPLLEPLLKALDRDPRRLDQVARLVDDLSRLEQGRSLLPEDFLRAWEPIWQARKAVRE